MAQRSTLTTDGKLPDKAVREQLDRILDSATFQQVDRLKRFLRFVVLEAIEGRAHQLKEYVIGVQVFGKEDAFDPRTDPIVRVQARRLRARLLRYYAESGQSDAIIVELPKGGYVPIFRRPDVRAVPRPTLQAALLTRNTIAVLPVADHSPDGSLGYFCRGMHDEVVHALGGLRSLRVTSGSGIGGEGDAGGAALVLTGSVRTSGARARISMQLADAGTGYYLWSEQLDVALTDILSAQEHVAHVLVEKLKPENLLGASGPFRPSENLTAHNLYLQGRYHLNQRTEEGLRKAVEFFEKALVEDAQFALAHSGLADAHGLLTHYGVLAPADVWTKAAASAMSAVMLDGNSAEAHTSLAHVRCTQDWDWAGAAREYERAIALNPRYPTAHHWYAMSCLVPMGRLTDAQDRMRVAQSLDPVSAIIARDAAVLQLYSGDLDGALDQCDHTIELNPHFAPAYLTLGVIQEQRNDFDESVAAFQRGVSLTPTNPRMHAALARTYALSGQPDKARRILRDLETRARERYVSPVEFALIHFALGADSVGFKWLTRACDDRSFELLALKADPRFGALKSDRRFQSVSKRVGLG